MNDLYAVLIESEEEVAVSIVSSHSDEDARAKAKAAVMEDYDFGPDQIDWFEIKDAWKIQPGDLPLTIYRSLLDFYSENGRFA